MQAIEKEVLKSNLDRLANGVEDLKKVLNNFQQALDGLKPLIRVLLEQKAEAGSA
jgi:hypothetical protein